MHRQSPKSKLFPYTTLFRSRNSRKAGACVFGTFFFHRLCRLRTLRSEEHTSELQSRGHLVCRLLLDKKYMYTWCVREGMLQMITFTVQHEGYHISAIRWIYM